MSFTTSVPIIPVSRIYVIPESVCIYKEGYTAYCYFEVQKGIFRGLAIVKIFEAIRRHWPFHDLDLHLDPLVLTKNQVGVVVQSINELLL